jgi:hypothetical protein
MNRSISYCIFFSLSFFVIFKAQAQFSKGTKQVGGNLKFYQYQTDNDYGSTTNFLYSANSTSRDISVLPRLGLFVKDNVSVGVVAGYVGTYSHSQLRRFDSTETEQTISTNLAEIQVVSRFHHLLIDRLAFFIEGGASTSFGKAKNSPGGGAEKVFGLGLGIKPGLILMITEKLGLETSIGFLGYQQETRKPLDRPDVPVAAKNTQKDFGLTLSLAALDFGMQYYF